jgi:UBX domain-containing protein 1/4
LEQSGAASKDTQPSTVIVAAPVAAASSTETVAKKDYSECKIQVRQTDGKSMVHVFKANEQLAAVRLWIEMNRTDCSDGSKFQLMQTFPKKVYTDDDMSKNLTELGLTPASSLVITKI